jgi:hypothetical protein
MMATTGVCIRFEKTDAITGTMIDLYADAEFMDFTFLRKILEEEIEKLYVKEKVWEVYTGTQVRTGKEGAEPFPRGFSILADSSLPLRMTPFFVSA